MKFCFKNEINFKKKEKIKSIVLDDQNWNWKIGKLSNLNLISKLTFLY